MMGERFTTVDILFGSMAEYARDSLPADPVIDAYAKRLRERPAMARAIEKDAPKAA
jgi:glutathione S-transferase